MFKFVEWEDLTETQKCHATEQFVELEAWQDECTIDEAVKMLIGHKVSNIGINKKLREITSSRSFEIDTEDEYYIYVDL